MSTDANEAVVRRFYEELWNEWRLDVAEEIVSVGLRFRGSLGTTLVGREEFQRYVETIRRVFPDWHNQIDEILAAGGRVVTRMTWSGTHRGTLDNVEATGASVEYCGGAFFRLTGGMIEEAWVVGDTQELRRALGQL